MLNFGCRDRIAEAKNTDKSALKPALYDPRGGSAKAATANATTRSGQAPIPPPKGPAASAPATSSGDAATQGPVRVPQADVPVSKLFVGVNIKLKGVDISDCDVLVIEGHVEATVHSKAMEIAKPGTLKGTAIIDVAEIHGEFSGDLTARTRLVVHGTGRVSGTIRYGKLIVAEGGELNGDVKRLEETEDSDTASRSASPLGRPPVGGFTPH